MRIASPHVLCWKILRWNFDVEHIDVTLMPNVQSEGSVSRLPMLVLKRKLPGVGDTPKRLKIWLLEGFKVDEMA